jgi:hypothetical protein
VRGKLIGIHLNMLVRRDPRWSRTRRRRRIPRRARALAEEETGYQWIRAPDRDARIRLSDSPAGLAA